MKFSKILSAAAAIAAAGMMTVAASAELVVYDDHDAGLSSGTGQWLVQVYNEGNEAENKPKTEYDIDYSKVAKISATIKVFGEDEIFWDGAVGGALVLSINGGDIGSSGDLFDKYNWVGEPSKEFWGVIDPELGLETFASDKPCTVTKVADYTYRIDSPEYNNPLANGDASTIGCMQIALQEWGASITRFDVESVEVKDASDNVMITFDGKGNATMGGGASTTNPPADSNAGGDSSNAGGDSANNPSAGGNVDTGVEGVAAVVGVAALAAGAVVLSRKRK